MTNTIPHDHQPHKEQEQAPAVVRPQMKRQARRRTHASRPYQERLLNMAEARREIVTALKIHRASMRQQQQQQQQPTYQHHEPTLLRQPPPLRQQEQQQQAQVVFQDQSCQQRVEEEAPLPAPASYYASFADHQLCNPLAQWIPAADLDGGSYYSSPVLPYDLITPLETPTVAMGGLEQLARSLPAQPLGLNLSFQGFGGGSVDGAKDGCEAGLFGVPLIQSSSTTASSYSGTEMASGTHGSPALSAAEKPSYSPVDAPAALIPAPDDVGETHGVEWSEATAASVWWSKILLESMESGGGDVAEGGAVGCTAEDVAAADFPAEWRWLCDVGGQVAATGGDDKPPDVLEAMLADGDCYTRCYEGGRRSDGGGDITLPCLDDIGGWDGEWPCSSS